MQAKTLVDVNDISFEYANGQSLFEHLKLTIQNESRIGVVGANGSGKTTLLKLIAGEETPTQGNIFKNAVVTYVPQIDKHFNQNTQTIESYLISKNENWWATLQKLEKIFGYTPNLSSQVKTLSGGEFMKINICLALTNNPDLLLLDEPTNHLDVLSMQMLVQFLNQSNFSYLIISHDAFFLDQVVNEIWEIENHKIKVYGGTYSAYQSQKKLFIDAQNKKFQSAQEKLKNTKVLLEKEKSRTAQNFQGRRRAYLKGSLGNFEYVGGERGKASFSTEFVKKIDKLQTQATSEMNESEIFKRKLPSVSFKDQNKKPGQTLLNVHDLDIYVENQRPRPKGRGLLFASDQQRCFASRLYPSIKIEGHTLANKLLIKNLNFNINYGDRLNIVGKNGSGKTTLIKKLLEISAPIYKKPDLKYLYIDQNYSLLQFNKNLIENMMEFLPAMTEFDAKSLLGKQQFKTTAEYKKLVSELSGGEMARLTLAIISALPLDLLILDEPTNNLDIETLELVISALNNYNGGLIVISHNIDFLSKINIDRSYLIQHQRLKLMMNLPLSKSEFLEEIKF